MKLWKRLLMATVFVCSFVIAGNTAAQDEMEATETVQAAAQEAEDSDEAEDDEEEDEIVVMETDISKLPEIVSAAAQGAKEDFAITGYTQETEVGQIVYDVYGLAGDLCYEIEVTENGQVLEIENCD